MDDGGKTWSSCGRRDTVARTSIRAIAAVTPTASTRSRSRPLKRQHSVVLGSMYTGMQNLTHSQQDEHLVIRATKPINLGGGDWVTNGRLIHTHSDTV
ncbi:hypothetical protein TELCIR_19320 [Teladorsagia circumcincta]|uniref:Uncharacterized protein n=1 Tax=Teladorsagia circumcincta TaxID=45464 RepID=A0A2G9TP20_TELCI|nr:hypothetical protein TELCIR_19320 [Teladorsagia circumcincta]